MTDEELLRALESATLDPDRWTHRAHLRVALTLLRRHDLPTAADRMRTAIRAYNAATGDAAKVAEYHETVTLFWLRTLDAAARTDPPRDGENADAFLDRHPDLLDKRLILRHYSRAALDSPAARTTDIAPDLAPIN